MTYPSVYSCSYLSGHIPASYSNLVDYPLTEARPNDTENWANSLNI
jgi:hypothetical protein